MTQAWKMVCRFDEVPVRGARVVQRQNGSPVAIFRSGDDHLFALLDRCPHKGGPLSQGMVLGKQVACPLHNWHIALDDGCAVLPDVGCAQTFSIQLVDGLVYLDQHELETRATESV